MRFIATIILITLIIASVPAMIVGAFAHFAWCGLACGWRMFDMADKALGDLRMFKGGDE